jgi:ribokinase
MSHKSIVVVGSSNTDMIIKLDRLPRPGETLLGGEFVMAAGGKGANQAVAAARAGGAVSFVAKVGGDVFGTQAVEGFKKDKINVQYVFKDKQAASGVALVFVARDGENSIAVASGANAHLMPADLKKARTVITRAATLVLQLETPLETVRAAAEIGAKKGVRVILNPAPARKLDNALLKSITIITPNESEAEWLTGIAVKNEADAAKAAAALRARGAQMVVITLGARGAFVASSELCQLVPAFKVKPVDTTGAGDVFNGALAVALTEGAPMLEAVRFANAAAALSTTKMGAQPSAPKRSEILKMLK